MFSPQNQKFWEKIVNKLFLFWQLNFIRFFLNHQNCKFTFLVLESEVIVYFAMSSLSHRAGEIYVSVQKYEKAIFGFFSDSFRTPISDVSRTYFRLLFFNDFMIFLLLFSSSSRLSSKKPIMNCQCERVNI